MKNLAACYGEHAIKVSDSYCSGSSNKAYSASILAPAIQTSVICVHKVKSLNQKLFFIRIKWCNLLKRGCSVSICDYPLSYDKFRVNSRILSKSRGAELYEFDNSVVEILWDFSKAKFESGPEPINGFYIVVTVDSGVALILGDMDQELEIKKRVCGTKVAKSSLISRSERFSGNILYSTRAKFSETGTVHDIMIKCFGDDGPTLRKNPVMYVYIDGRIVVKVMRLRWNF